MSRVRMWRHLDEDSVLPMAGQTTSYAVEPRGEYVEAANLAKFAKLRLGDRIQAVIFAYESGITQPGHKPTR